jgi:NAD(P)-dependent dehydrogenase (short-subunit alcohol dehydrogenase family)
VLTLPLDVTDKGAVDGALVAAHERFGRLDVVVNNAGYGLVGSIEELSKQQARAQLETNLFGDGPLEIIHAEYERRLALWDEWAELSVRAHGSKS